MKLLTLPNFIPLLQPFANKELLTPTDASKLIFMITELLLDHHVDMPLLKFLSRFLTLESYDDIIEERNIEHQCGYIICDQSPSHRIRRLSSNSNGTTIVKDGNGETKFQIYNRKPSIILPNTFSSQYCCKQHYQASLFYRNQLSPEAIFARKNIMVLSPFPESMSSWFENTITSLEEVLAKHEELRHQGKSLMEVVEMMGALSMHDDGKDTAELVKLIEDFEIIEKDLSQIDDDSGIYEETNVEGYITTNKSFGGYVV